MKYIATFLLYAGIVWSSYSQNDSSSHILDEVLILENRIQIPFSKQIKNISLVDRFLIETSPGRSVQEILGFVAGVDVRQRGVAGVQSDIGIRGGSFDQTLLLINGIKLSDPQTGHHLMNITLPLIDVDRIEVVKGPASRIFGQNAFAGAINLITRLSELPSLKLQGYVGDFGLIGLHFSGSLPVGKIKQRLSFSQDKSDGYQYNSDFRIDQIFYENELQLNEKNSFRTMVGFADRTFGANGFYTSAFPDQWESVQTRLASLSHTFNSSKWYLNTRGYVRKNNDEYRLRRNEPEFYQNRHSSEVLAIEGNANYKSKWGTTGIGIEGRKESIQSSNLGDHNRFLFGVFLEHLVNLGNRTDLRLGVFSNHFSEYGWKHYPGLEFGVQLSNSVRVYSGIGTSFRIPTYTDLYYKGPTNLGNENLVPEQGRSFEVGGKWAKSNWRAEMVYFNRYSDNLIDWVRLNNQEPWKPQNFNEVKFQGLETSISYRVNPNGKTVQLKNLILTYNIIDTDFLGIPGMESRYSLTALKNQLISGVLLGLGKKVETDLKLRYVERINLSPYALIDIRINFNRVGKIGFFTEVSNLTNQDYIEAGTVQMPGRWFKGGFLLNLDQWK